MIEDEKVIKGGYAFITKVVREPLISGNDLISVSLGNETHTKKS